MSVLLQSMSPLDVLGGIARRVGDLGIALRRLAIAEPRVEAGESVRVPKVADAVISGGANGKPRILEARRLRLERRQMRNLLI